MTESIPDLDLVQRLVDRAAVRYRVGPDQNRQGLHLTDLSIRNILDRIDPLCTLSSGESVSAPADAVAAAIGDRDAPIHRRRDNHLAGAPLSDGYALHRMRKHAQQRACEAGATILFAVPPPIAGWIRLRYQRAERLMARLSADA